jgi:holo-[acyl-carrier protein] synthase
MPVIAVGTDICDVRRIKDIEEKYAKRFLRKVFTTQEISYCLKKVTKHTSLAARFAAKEALLKALGTGLRSGLQWKEIEIDNDQLGKPFFRFHGHTKKTLSGRSVLLSMSHTEQNAIAFVIIEGDPF